jgi:hypothetical protein
MKILNSTIGKPAITASAILIALAGVAQIATADVIPYANKGTPTTNPGTFTALFTGDVMAYFTGSEAGYTDLVAMSVNGSVPSPSGFVFPNQPNITPGSTQIGGVVDLGPVTIGQTISFVLMVTPNGGSTYYLNSTTPGTIFSTTAPDGGTYVGFEDLTANNDYDYNDETFVFQNHAVENIPPVVPEPTTIVAGALLLLPLGVSTLRILRNRKTA